MFDFKNIKNLFLRHYEQSHRYASFDVELAGNKFIIWRKPPRKNLLTYKLFHKKL